MRKPLVIVLLAGVLVKGFTEEKAENDEAGKVGVLRVPVSGLEGDTVEVGAPGCIALTVGDREAGADERVEELELFESVVGDGLVGGRRDGGREDDGELDLLHALRGGDGPEGPAGEFRGESRVG